ncbi:MAG TPA: cytochrome c oxidase subunit II [Gemmataceae bacterium]|nr:cytochrome c oxidase subunit II [Gemmataceae bacterium]
MPLAQVPLWPEQASTIAPRVDALTIFLIALSAFFTIVIFTTLIYFAAKYRRRYPDQQGEPVKGGLQLELTWTIIPLLIALGIFAWGADVYFEVAHAPDDSMDVYVVGKQWMWYTQHMTGQRENQGLTVPLGRSVKLTMVSQDVIHDFSMPAFRIKMDVVPGRASSMWFKATKTGKFHLFCGEYCGTNHSRMVGWVTVLEPTQFQQWLGSLKVDGSPASEGRKLFLKYQCATCHSGDAQARAPLLENLYGKKVALEGGGSVLADDDYIRESILLPDAKIVAGYRPIMPSFRGQISDVELLQLVAFIKALGPGQTPPRIEEGEPPAAAPQLQPQQKKP